MVVGIKKGRENPIEMGIGKIELVERKSCQRLKCCAVPMMI